MDDRRWLHINKVLSRPGATYMPPTHPLEALKHCYICVVGAGGLGCEVLKNLALSGFKNIDIVDESTVAESDLNRAVLFKKADIGKPKAVVAASFVNNRVPGVFITPHHKNIRDVDEEFFLCFNLIISCTKRIHARKYLSSILVGLVEKLPDDVVDTDTVIPWIEGATDGFKGVARVTIPCITSCVECAKDCMASPEDDPLKIAIDWGAHIVCDHLQPRLPEHIILKAFWCLCRQHPQPKVFNDALVKSVFETASKFNETLGILGVTLSRTKKILQVLFYGHKLDLIAPTTSIIAASICNEAFKICTNSSAAIENVMEYHGSHGVRSCVLDDVQNKKCLSCGPKLFTFKVSTASTLQQIIQEIRTKYDLDKPLLRQGGKSLYVEGLLLAATSTNLDKTLPELGVAEGDVIDVSCVGSEITYGLVVRFEDKE